MKKIRFVSILFFVACGLAAWGFAGPAGAASTAIPKAVSITTYPSTVLTVGQSYTFKATVYSDTAMTTPIKTAKVTWKISNPLSVVSEEGTATASNTISSGGAFKAAAVGECLVTATVTGYPTLTDTESVTVVQAFTGGKFTGYALDTDGVTKMVLLGISATKTTFKGLGMDLSSDPYNRDLTGITGGKIASDGSLSASFTGGGGGTVTLTGQLVYENYLIAGMTGTWKSTGSSGTQSGNWTVNLDTAPGAGPKLGTYSHTDPSSNKAKTGTVGIIVYTDTTLGNVYYAVNATVAFTCKNSGAGQTANLFTDNPSLWDNGAGLSFFELSAPLSDYSTEHNCTHDDITAYGNGSYSSKKASGKLYDDSGMTTATGIWSVTDM